MIFKINGTSQGQNPLHKAKMLPNELWEEIFTFCDPISKYQLLGTNRFFHNLFHSQKFIPTHPNNIVKLKNTFKCREIYPIDDLTWAIDVDLPCTHWFKCQGKKPVKRIVKSFCPVQ